MFGFLFLAPYARTTRYEEAFLPKGKKRPRSLRSLGLASLKILWDSAAATALLLTGFKNADNTEENTERRWRWERDRTLARQYSSRPINSIVLGEIYELCEGCGEFMIGYFAERCLSLIHI